MARPKLARWRTYLINIALVGAVLLTAWLLWPRGGDLAQTDGQWKWGSSLSCAWLEGEDGQELSAQQIGAAHELSTAEVADLQALCALDQRDPRQRTAVNYERSYFGEGWADLDGDGCNTRNEILARDLSQVRRSRSCVVRSGRLDDPYTGQVVDFVAGPETSAQVQIDHVVALAAAWRAGADKWDSAQRLHYANDPLVLLAVEGQANQDKGAADADEWLPPNQAYHCPYVRRQIAIKTKWHLSVTPAERQRMLQVLANC